MARVADRSLAREGLDRLLTHRVHGFRDDQGRLLPEGSLEALDRALEQGVKWVEIDTRVTADGEILVYHDRKLDKFTDGRGLVSKHSGPLKFTRPRETTDPPGEPEPTDIPVPTLEQFLDRFAGRSADVRLQVDLKDPIDPRKQVEWIEREHCRLIDEAGLVDRTWIISWYPEILCRVFKIDRRFRLGFSHMAWPAWKRPLTGPARLIARPRLIAGLGRLLARKHPNLEGVELYFDDEQPRSSRAQRTGRFPIHVLTRLPAGELADALRATGGGVGLCRSQLRRSYVRAARADGLKTYVYTFDETESYLNAVREAGPDIVFSDAAASILADLAAAERSGGA